MCKITFYVYTIEKVFMIRKRAKKNLENRQENPKFISNSNVKIIYLNQKYRKKMIKIKQIPSF